MDLVSNDDPFLEQIRAAWMKPHEYILIQGELSAEDDFAIQNKLVKMNGKQAKAQEFTLNLGDVKRIKLERMVKGWNIVLTKHLPDGSTREVPVPFSAANILKLPKRYVDYMDAEIKSQKS